MFFLERVVCAAMDKAFRFMMTADNRVAQVSEEIRRRCPQRRKARRRLRASYARSSETTPDRSSPLRYAVRSRVTADRLYTVAPIARRALRTAPTRPNPSMAIVAGSGTGVGLPEPPLKPTLPKSLRPVA